jgi:hypothetical protein
MDWSKEREWDNETEWWADGVKPISTPQITIENRHYKDITSRRQVD